MNEMLNTLGKNARNAEVLVRNLSANEKNEVLLKVAEAPVSYTHLNSRTQVKKVTGKDCLQESLFITGRGLLLSVWQLQSFWERSVTGSYILFRHYTVMPASSLSRSIMGQRPDL